MRQHHTHKLVPGGFQALLTVLRIALLVTVTLAFGLAVHLLNITTH